MRVRSSHVALLGALLVGLGGCERGRGGANEDAVSLPLSSAPQVASDGNGNFMAVWESGVSLVARYYEQGVGGQNFVLGQGTQATLAMGTGVSHVMWSERLNSRYEIRGRVHDGATDSWGSLQRIFNLRGIPEQIIWPSVAAYGDRAILTFQGWGGRDDSTRTNLSTEYLDIFDDSLPFPYWEELQNQQINALPPEAANPRVKHPKVAMGANRAAMVAFADQATSREGIQVYKYAPTPEPVRRTAIPGFWTGGYWRFKVGSQSGVVNATGYDIKMQANGDAFLIWQQGTSIFGTHYSTATDSWEPAQAVGASEALEEAALAIHDSGYALVVAQSADQVMARHYVPGGAGNPWQPPIRLNLGGMVTGTPDVAISPDGNALAVWVEDGDITIARFDGSTWGTPTVIGQGETPRVALEDGGSCLVVWVQDGFIFDYSCNVPTATFTHAPVQPIPGATVTFDASGSFDDAGTIVSYEWDFDGNGSIDAMGETVLTTYATAGDYTVTLTVRNDRGVSATATTVVTVGTDVVLSMSLRGSGSVASSNPGISCPTDCGETYQLGDIVTLIATPAPDWAFDRWQGNCAAGIADRANPMLIFTVTGATTAGVFTCVAEFLPVTGATLTTSITTNGLIVIGSVEPGGRITSSPAGIDCSSANSDCTEVFPGGSSVTLTATPFAGYEFIRWDSNPMVAGCTPTDPAMTVVTFSNPFECQAAFRTIPVSGDTRNVTILFDGPTGRVTDRNTGMLDCTATCTVALPVAESPIYLRATNGATTWVSWAGNCDAQVEDLDVPGGPPLCRIDITTRARSVLAVFEN